MNWFQHSSLSLFPACVCDARTHKEKAAPLIHTAFINHKKELE
jgi:hypothetical protein